jgi:hypothetical protein
MFCASAPPVRRAVTAERQALDYREALAAGRISRIDLAASG